MFIRTLAAAILVAQLSATANAQQTQQQQTQQQQQQQQQRGALATLALSSNLTGSEVMGDSGSKVGSAMADLSVVHASKELCYTFTFKELNDWTNAGLFKASKGQVGPSVAALTLRRDSTTAKSDTMPVKSCVTLSETVYNDIIANPDMYYVQVSTVAFPRGAIRGQVVKPPTTPRLSRVPR